MIETPASATGGGGGRKVPVANEVHMQTQSGCHNSRLSGIIDDKSVVTGQTEALQVFLGGTRLKICLKVHKRHGLVARNHLG